MSPERDEYYMRRALELAHEARLLDEVPVGALVVVGDRIVAEAYNRREIDLHPFAHAELSAMHQASQKLGRWRLHDATVYVTLEPCPMCAGGLVNARVKRLVYGAKDPKAGAIDSLYQITQDARLNHEVEVCSGVLEPACAEILTSFFKEKRARAKALKRARKLSQES